MSGIDRWLESEETGEHFSHCLRCKLPLAENFAGPPDDSGFPGFF